MDGLAEYRAVVARVDAFSAAVSERRAADMLCRAGCDSCCRVQLEVSGVEAAAVRLALAGLAPERRSEVRARAGVATDACAMLGPDGRCAIYEARPLVCRTQGLPLRYPPGFVPAEAVGLRLGAKGDATWCPLNFRERVPAGGDVLDAELVDRLLAVVNQRHCAATGEDQMARHPLRDLAARV